MFLFVCLIFLVVVYWYYVFTKGKRLSLVCTLKTLKIFFFSKERSKNHFIGASPATQYQ